MTSPPQDGFAVANLGQRPRIREAKNHKRWKRDSLLGPVRSYGLVEARFQRLLLV